MRTVSHTKSFRNLLIGSTAICGAIGATILVRKIRQGIENLNVMDIFGAPEGGNPLQDRRRITDEYEEGLDHVVA